MAVGIRGTATERRWIGLWLGLSLAFALFVAGLSAADEPCKGRRGLDPRTARLQVLDIQVTQQGIVGKVKNSSDETALGVMVWVNYYMTRRGGLMAQQCIPVGDLRSGEERGFQALLHSEANRAESWDYAADAAGWR